MPQGWRLLLWSESPSGFTITLPLGPCSWSAVPRVLTVVAFLRRGWRSCPWSRARWCRCVLSRIRPICGRARSAWSGLLWCAASCRFITAPGWSRWTIWRGCSLFSPVLTSTCHTINYTTINAMIGWGRHGGGGERGSSLIGKEMSFTTF